ncbi:hypothetical protein [Microbacterium sp. NIBRBAC000506063]|uniref:hypothetical protein n=1 Tax=Microbacterium sp. NIBRBAC000506063 TaxID=2734618 RepID=UPI001BB75635|nr:hypothetical protein [Microbacterium sp. NIBRBAC000506063]QTV79805.1 hypothetical protein KAE78_00630 [Microbacterium sp. NIBRBAC000506063]
MNETSPQPDFQSQPTVPLNPEYPGHRIPATFGSTPAAAQAEPKKPSGRARRRRCSSRPRSSAVPPASAAAISARR